LLVVAVNETTLAPRPEALEKAALSGVSLDRSPPRWLAPGDVLTSYIGGVGDMRHTLVARW
jgi:hypothetical protein